MIDSPGLHFPDAVPATPGGGDGSIEINPRALERLKKALTEAAELLETDRFADVELAPDAFGASPAGTELGAEHRTAHAIIADTIQGVVTDLWGYREGVEQFETGMGTVDETAAEDLRNQEVALEALAVSVAGSHGDRSYQSSQVDHLPAVNDRGDA